MHQTLMRLYWTTENPCCLLLVRVVVTSTKSRMLCRLVTPGFTDVISRPRGCHGILNWKSWVFERIFQTDWIANLSCIFPYWYIHGLLKKLQDPSNIQETSQKLFWDPQGNGIVFKRATINFMWPPPCWVCIPWNIRFNWYNFKTMKGTV